MRSEATSDARLYEIVVTAFCNAVRRYVSDGREAQYVHKREISSFVRGRIDVADTAMLRARGLGHLVSMSGPMLSRATTLNEVLSLTLRLLELRISSQGLPEALVAEVRTLAMAFQDCRRWNPLGYSPVNVLNHIDELLAVEQSESRRHLLLFLRVTLAQQGFGVGEIVGQLPDTWFINLELLFEHAVREVLREGIGSKGRVCRGGEQRAQVFTGRRSAFMADPDIVIQSPSGSIVADAKYKTMSESTAHSDLYQLLVHAAAFGAERAFLVFPGSECAVRALGTSVTGVDTYLCAVRLGDLRADVCSIVKCITSAEMCRTGVSDSEPTLGADTVPVSPVRL